MVKYSKNFSFASSNLSGYKRFLSNIPMSWIFMLLANWVETQVTRNLSIPIQFTQSKLCGNSEVSRNLSLPTPFAYSKLSRNLKVIRNLLISNHSAHSKLIRKLELIRNWKLIPFATSKLSTVDRFWHPLTFHSIC